VSNRPIQQPIAQRVIRRITTLDLPKQPSELPTIPEGNPINVANASELERTLRNRKEGDVIVLKPGVYNLNGNLNISPTLGNRISHPIVLYGDPGDPQKVQIRIRNGRINISNTPIDLIGLDISSANGEGIRVEGEAEVGIWFCHIHSCKSHGIYSSANIFVNSSVISGNGNGFQSARSRFDVSNSRIEHNKNYGITITRTSRGRLSDNILFDNSVGNWRVDGAVQN
jgi:parallel beta-helix repeat protein